MLRNLFAGLAGGVFGFVLGGAVLPMAVAWAFAARRDRAALGTPMPDLPKPVAEPDLVVSSVLFGMGWGSLASVPARRLPSSASAAGKASSSFSR